MGTKKMDIKENKVSSGSGRKEFRQEKKSSKGREKERGWDGGGKEK
jgi:hypothetical protein